MKKFWKFDDVINWTKQTMHDYCYEVHTEKWQGREIKEDSRFRMIEILNHSFSCAIDPDLDELRRQINPSMPWADDHFQERVGGKPLNPPPSHNWWPYAQKNNAEFGGLEKFSHTYPERMWSKFASEEPNSIMQGVRYEYGDLQDVVNLIHKEPFTRQAFLPIWFPEDTGVVFGGRVPCTIGYHFIRRFNHLHVVYYIRSCDFFRHFRDDIYMCARKVIWMIERLRELDPVEWNDVQPGMLTMHITSLHAFSHEKRLLAK
jgi:hypothetical protein